VPGRLAPLLAHLLAGGGQQEVQRRALGLVQQLLLGVADRFEGVLGARVGALVGVHGQGDLAVGAAHVVGRRVKAEGQRLKGVELEGAQDAVHLVLAVHLAHIGVEGLRQVSAAKGGV
jgi:hypothetical protein